MITFAYISIGRLHHHLVMESSHPVTAPGPSSAPSKTLNKQNLINSPTDQITRCGSDSSWGDNCLEATCVRRAYKESDSIEMLWEVLIGVDLAPGTITEVPETSDHSLETTSFCQQDLRHISDIDGWRRIAKQLTSAA
jgi:hypothetical protein